MNHLKTFTAGLKMLLILIISGFWRIAEVSCQASAKKFLDQEIMIRVPQSELYLRLRGNPEKPLLVNLHGGPGGYSGIDIALMGPYLESDYLVAYLDQRGCGKSLRCDNQQFLTVKQYVDDLNIVIDTLLSKFNKEQTNLMGTSWGGMYGFLYILQHPGKIKSYACIDGKANSEYQNNALIELELSLAGEMLKNTQEESKKKELQFVMNELERIRQSDLDEFYKDVNWMKHQVPGILGFNAYFADTSKIISMKKVLQDTALLALMNYTKEEYMDVGDKAEIVNEKFRNNKEYNNLNIEPELRKIHTPTMVIQGGNDFVVGEGHAKLIYDALKSLPEKNKELHIIPGVGHCPAIEAPEALAVLLNDFFKKHN